MELIAEGGGGRARQSLLGELAPSPSAEGAGGCGALLPWTAGFGGTQGSASLPHIHHVDEWSHVKYPICQEPSALAGVHRFSSRPSSVYVVPSA